MLEPIYDGMLDCWRWRDQLGVFHATNDKPADPAEPCHRQPGRDDGLCPICRDN